MKVVRSLVLIALFALPVAMRAQKEPGNFEAGAAWGHLSGDFGLDGVTGTFGYRMHNYVTLVAQGNFLWDTSKVGAFTLSTTTGQFSIHSNYQDGLAGARFHILGVKRHIRPFGEALIGYSRLHQSVTAATGVFNSDNGSTGFTWLVGGGGDYRLTDNWAARGSLDFVRTHFVSEGQSRYRFTLGLVYHF